MLRVLGKGGYGSVIALDDRRVCKIQHSLPEHDLGVSAAALREMAALRRLYAPLRMLLHRSGTSAIEATRYHESLLDAIRRWRRERRAEVARGGAVSEAWAARVLRIVAELAAELGRAHAAGFLHRDLKPENVMLDAAGRAHLIDWGMSRWVGEGSGAGRFTPGMATLWYRAPELFTGDAYGAAVDVWSLGVLLVELVAGRCPFRGSSELQQIRHYLEVLGPPPRGALPRWPFPEAMLREGEPEPCRSEAVWAAVPEIADVPGLADLVDRMLRWDPRARATVDEILLHPVILEAAAAGHGTLLAAPHSHLPPPPPRLLPPRPPPPGALRAVNRALRSVILARCSALRLPLSVAFAAGRLLLRSAESPSLRSDSHLSFSRISLDALLCLDLANKLVGLQHRSVLAGIATSANLERLTRREVRLVNRRIGVPQLGLCFVRMPASPLARRLLREAFVLDPCAAVLGWASGRERDAQTLDTLARFVSTGGGMGGGAERRGLKELRAGRRGSCSSRSSHHLASPRLARLVRRAVAKSVLPSIRDRVLRRRLSAGVAGL
jgi:serine/threonine protein kinase